MNPNKMSAEECYRYARDVIKKRWPEAEKKILTHPEWSYCYACDVIKKRWPEAEKVLIQYPECWDGYVKYILNGDETTAELIKCLNTTTV